LTLLSVDLDFPGRPYQVLIGEGALEELPRLVRELEPSRVALVTDGVVGPHWAESVWRSLSTAGVQGGIVTLEAGERSKSMAGLARVLEAVESIGLDRSGLVIALGGGTVGDLAGFAAAVWMRGVRCLQVPTTLLAMVDSSVGGKTGINTELTKNAVGAFWQPVAVVSDLAMLTTLPDDEYLVAFGEIVKYAVAMDSGLASLLARSAPRLVAREVDLLREVVATCVRAKAGVVAADERDQGQRAILNYGHTTGHALEVTTGYQVAHGRAVAFGMRVAARVGAGMGLCETGLVAEQDRLLEAFGLPGRLPTIDPEALLAALPRDKKARGGAVSWVLPRELGQAEPGHRVDPVLVREVLQGLVTPEA
jgi:3-dehydroquinate synthase